MLSASQLPTWQLCNLHNSATQLRRWQRVMESSPQALGAEVPAGKAGPKSLAACRAGAPQASQGWLLSLLTSPKRPFGSILCLSEMYFRALCSGPERQKEAWRIGEYPQRLCHVLKKMVKEKAAQGPERQKEAWRIGEYPQRLCHVLKKMVKEKAAQGPERQKEVWRIGEYPQRLCHVLKKMVKEKAAQGGCLSVCSLKDWGSRVSR
ncbi:uncharacterized protein LOC128072928 isoform X7 [Tympanuchus pallidicinctus]|uniref:uncharacterized protein LOC128072928 isoform X6 n=1 Tax=Tympanuchus pallidicinctus TaxID=109042 RepID=UPI0022870AE4|nr:uncharacterized protein LOC128072928 isoform X6 [Tympanuchus pallidicinctus]XP_052523119.1 uncharacterized protein LOC128072928 isoform X7 [Tympanuchus pallidicinctus]